MNYKARKVIWGDKYWTGCWADKQILLANGCKQIDMDLTGDIVMYCFEVDDNFKRAIQEAHRDMLFVFQKEPVRK